jgi:hypothetical protein
MMERRKILKNVTIKIILDIKERNLSKPAKSINIMLDILRSLKFQ